MIYSYFLLIKCGKVFTPFYKATMSSNIVFKCLYDRQLIQNTDKIMFKIFEFNKLITNFNSIELYIAA